jgi:hypothetical protein
MTFSFTTPCRFDRRTENIESITLVLSAYASFVLPVLFGLVGMIASFLRDISNRITSSILAPRDETLAIIRRILGPIAGLAVGRSSHRLPSRRR